jgi:hypothetical protein
VLFTSYQVPFVHAFKVSDVARPQTWWLEPKSAFAVTLPKKSPVYGPSFASGFATDLENLFSKEKQSISKDGAKAMVREDDDWAELESIPDTRSISMSTRPREPEHVERKPEALPSLLTLARPDILFSTLTPYLMHVSSSGKSNVTVSGTHEPSLRLLAEYLQRWVKQNPQDVRKVSHLAIHKRPAAYSSSLILLRFPFCVSSLTSRASGWDYVMIRSRLSRSMSDSGMLESMWCPFWPSFRVCCDTSPCMEHVARDTGNSHGVCRSRTDATVVAREILLSRL